MFHLANVDVDGGFRRSIGSTIAMVIDSFHPPIGCSPLLAAERRRAVRLGCDGIFGSHSRRDRFRPKFQSMPPPLHTIPVTLLADTLAEDGLPQHEPEAEAAIRPRSRSWQNGRGRGWRRR
jgi:hypothetical protein